jgi:hypothetical protein
MLEAKNMTAEALHFLDPRTRYFHEDVNFKYLDHEKKKWYEWQLPYAMMLRGQRAIEEEKER